MLTASECLKKWGMPEPTLEWEGRLMVLWDVPTSINDAIPALPNKIYCNRLMPVPLENAFRLLIKRDLHVEIRTWDGCYNIRKMRGLASRSLHSWGVAIDLNAAWNGLGKVPSFSKEFADCFKACGFDWGGDWAMPRTDGMHFQLKSL